MPRPDLVTLPMSDIRSALAEALDLFARTRMARDPQLLCQGLLDVQAARIREKSRRRAARPAAHRPKQIRDPSDGSIRSIP